MYREFYPLSTIYNARGVFNYVKTLDFGEMKRMPLTLATKWLYINEYHGKVPLLYQNNTITNAHETLMCELLNFVHYKASQLKNNIIINYELEPPNNRRDLERSSLLF